jgi:hypothetical protein
VKRVTYETMDCGAMPHRWAESQFEISVPARVNGAADRGYMPVEKFLRIIERVEAELPLNGNAVARIHVSFAGQPAALYDIETVEARDGALWIELAPDKTRCKAAERQRASVPGGGRACGADEAEGKEIASGCGCSVGAGAGETAAATCCA